MRNPGIINSCSARTRAYTLYTVGVPGYIPYTLSGCPGLHPVILCGTRVLRYRSMFVLHINSSSARTWAYTLYTVRVPGYTSYAVGGFSGLHPIYCAEPGYHQLMLCAYQGIYPIHRTGTRVYPVHILCEYPDIYPIYCGSTRGYTRVSKER